MMHIRRKEERGLTEIAWLKSYHTFSFGDYWDPEWQQYRALRVFNEDVIQPKAGFRPHGHHDMEILSYVLEGGLKHKDSMGHETLIKPSDVQLMSAGQGIIHEEMNAYDDRETHFLQIWLLPRQQGAQSRYQQKSIEGQFALQNTVLIVSPDGENGSLAADCDVRIYVTRLKSGDSVDLSVSLTRYAWLQVLRGDVQVGGAFLKAGDAAYATGQTLKVQAKDNAEMMFFDLA